MNPSVSAITLGLSPMTSPACSLLRFLCVVVFESAFFVCGFIYVVCLYGSVTRFLALFCRNAGFVSQCDWRSFVLGKRYCVAFQLFPCLSDRVGFLHETAVKQKLTRLRGWVPQGERLNHGHPLRKLGCINRDRRTDLRCPIERTIN